VNKNSRISTLPSPPDPPVACPSCGQTDVTVEVRPLPFRYGEGETAVELEAAVPLHLCGSCRIQFLDRIGEERQHAAVCAHLGLLAPDQIRILRMKYKMTRANFARATGIGEASLARWERGELLQSVAYDRYLRLLESPHNFECVRAMVDGKSRRDLSATRGSELSSAPQEHRKRFRFVSEDSYTPAQRSYSPVRRTA